MDKLTGTQVYGADLKLPGMLNAAIKDCPVFGGTVKSFEADKVKGMPGVRHVVQVGDSGVAVVADTWWQAKTALDALPIVWDEGPNARVSSASIAAMLKEGLDADQAFVANQNGEAAFAATTAASGLPAEKCEVYKLPIGGGFGRRVAHHDYVTQAILIAKEMPGTPVKLLWTREEDMLHGRYHPVMQCNLMGAFDAGNNLTALHMRLSGQSILSAVWPAALQEGKGPVVFQGLNPSGDFALGYSVPNLLIDHAMRNTHVPPGFWRGVNINQNAIFLDVSSTSWPTPPARIRSSSGAS